MGKKNFYAIKNTKEIFANWAECQEALKSVQAPVYKGFTTEDEALAFIENDTEILTKVPDTCFFVDGSYNPKNGLVGSAFIYIEDGIITNGTTVNSTTDSMGLKEEWSSMRNVAGEIKAVLEVLKFCKTKHIKNITICYDYQGLECWANGYWKTKNEFTHNYAKEVRKMRIEGYDIKFVKVKAHTGVQSNEIVDLFAKLICGIN